MKFRVLRTGVSIISLILIFQIFTSLVPLDLMLDSIKEENFTDIGTTEIIAENEGISDITSPLSQLQSFQSPSILFLVGDDTSLDNTYDVPFYNFMSSNLGFNVTYHTANDSYSYSNYDAIVISNTAREDMVATLVTAPIPILTMQPGHGKVFALGNNFFGFEWDTAVNIPAKGFHYILEDEILGSSKTVYNPAQYVWSLKGFSKLPSGCEVVQLAYKDFKYAVIAALEKDDLDYNLSPTSERRVYWGIIEAGNFVQDTWDWWKKSLYWTLYDDFSGNGTIEVNVQDNQNVTISNAEVKLIDSNNMSISWVENTSQSGSTVFTNIPWGQYDIEATFKGEVNDSLTNLEIIPPRTYIDVHSFDFSVAINVSVDDLAPIISDITFDNSTLTFFANVTDTSPIRYVLLNLTAYNSFTESTEIPVTEFKMEKGIGNTYFNATSLETLNGSTTNITVIYNIIVEDIAGNYFASAIRSIALDDPIAPYIWSYESFDFGNGTIEFTANITDENGIQAPVILDINGIHYEMYQGVSNLWEFKGSFDYNIFLNYTIYSTSDTVGNLNGSSIYPGLFPNKNVTTTDITPPRLSALSDSFAQHEEGVVEFSIHVDDWSEYQSGVNSSKVFIILEINGVNVTYNMTAIGEVTFVFDYTFNYNDNISYWIQAYDNASNSVISSPQPFGQPVRIDDNEFPSVSFSAVEYGNGTIDFFSQVLDWPNNDTSARIYFTNDYFANITNWGNESMIGVNSTSYHFRITNFPYQTQAIWYYVNALDSENNLYTTQIESAKSLQLTDIVAPVIEFTCQNSTSIDGEIIIVASAIDPYGPVYLLNNSICINISSVQGDISAFMSFESGTTYTFNISYQDQTELNITLCVSDINGNTGLSSIILLVADKAPPTIVQSGIESFINGTLTIYTEVIEGINGSGLLDDNSSITLNYVYKTPYYETMLWNGTGNYFTFPIPGLNPNDAVFYRFLITDKANNTLTTDWEQFFIADTLAPIINSFNTTETPKDYISTEVTFWINSRDEFGEIGVVLLNYSVKIDLGWENYSYQMSQVSLDYYEKTISFLPNTTIRYQIIVIDTFNNVAMTESILMTISDFNPAQFGENGIIYDTNNPGQVIIWIIVNDIFDEHLHNVTVTVIDLNTSAVIIDDQELLPEGINYLISVKIDYLHQFSYSLVLVDTGVQSGYYDADIMNSIVFKMEDNWNPTIHGAGFTRDSVSTYSFWANITDWGSGEDPYTLDAFLNYSLETVTGGGSEVSITYEQKGMIFNGTLFVASITFQDSGTLTWMILASDRFSLSSSYIGVSTPIVLNPVSGGFEIEEIVAAVIVTSIAFLIVLSSIMTRRRRRTQKLDRKQSFVTKLSFLADTYTVMVSSSVGVPIWSITNVLYQSDDTMNGNLSGLSVGIDSFLDSFQSDFLSQVQDSLSQSSDQVEGNIKLSVIEQNKVQILIIGSNSYRIFVFLKEIPSTFIRETFLNIIKDMEKDLPLQDFGIIDEQIQGPLVKSVIDKYLPVDLLKTFKIDLDRLSDVDERLKIEKTVSGMTRAGVDVLKILSVSNLAHSSSRKLNKQSLLKLFNQTHLSESQLYSGTQIYKDSISILNKLADFSPEEFYEAFWIGIDKKVRILVPLDNI